ncbi:hypothetical protein ELQ90_09640 [Labedella phragmitis]|uniref:DUF3618 domain-containing protein n=1 Tax=Labedella phragmitis TaxID=2498849 RepID=A0A444PT57_9MICO|nr:hypothetical protein [Labedella phragmitis]RWZ51048.1 hypothetical protein ELQ90_09640 [Labedella phragmitis]
MTGAGDAAATPAGASIPQLNLDLERARLEFRETIGAIEERMNIAARFRRWREDATGADRAFPAAIAAGAAIAVVAVIGIVGAVRSHAR